jgi:uncharacterized membrane protein YccC
LTGKTLHTALFAFRCTGAGTAALALASVLGLEHPVWSAMSALIVSQEQLDATKASVASRILGTIIGIGTACGVNLLIARLGASLYLQVAIAVLVCALLVHRFPQLRVSLWTCTLILASSAATSVTQVGLYRGEEVILGTLIGGSFHAMAEAMLRFRQRREGLETPQPSCDK